MQAESTCSMCGEDVAYSLVFHKDGIPVYRCRACGVGKAVPGEFDAASYYDASYFNGGRSDGYSDYVQASEVLHAQFRHELALLRKLGARDGGRLLELGCAYGYFLDVAREKYKVSGLELCEDAVLSCQARGYEDVHRGEVSREALARFPAADVVVMLDVIEHLPDPASALAAAAERLEPGGLLLMTTGDFSSLFARLTGRQWRLMTPPQHLWFFTPRSLQAACRSLGLELVHLDHPWKKVPVGLIVYQLCRYLSLQPNLPRWMHHMGVPVNLFDAMRLVFRKQATA